MSKTSLALNKLIIPYKKIKKKTINIGYLSYYIGVNRRSDLHERGTKRNLIRFL